MFQKPTTKAFRQALIERYPALKNAAYMALFRNLLFRSYERQTFEDDHIITHRWLAAINGHKDWKNFNSGQFLEDFKQDVLRDFEYSFYSVKGNKARCVVNYGIPVDIYSLLEQHIAVKPNIFLESGYRLSNRSTKEGFYTAAVEEADQLAEEYGISEQAKKIMRWHNYELETNTLSRMVNVNYADAEAYVETLKGSPAYERTREILKDISIYPKPVLTPVKVADRLFESHPLIGSVKSEVRKILTRGERNYELDLVSSQLAIVARLWNVKELIEFIEAGKPIWEHLQEFYDRPGLKDAFKKTLYGICYGAGRSRLTAELESILTDYSPEEFLNVFLEIPLIKKLWEAREARLKKVCEGKRTGDFLINPIRGTAIRKPPTSELAIEAQAIELDILSAIYELQYRHTDEFKILVYSFDGLTVSFARNRTVERFQRRITEAVERRAREKWNVKTSLKWEKL